MFCAECGNPIPDESRFCQACGAQMPAPENAGAPPAPAPLLTSAPVYGPAPGGPTPPPRRRAGLIPGSIIAAVILLAGLGVGLFFGLKGDGSPTTAQTTTTAVVASSTTSAPTTTTVVAPSSSTTVTTAEPSTTTSKKKPTTTTTEEPTTTTENRAQAFKSRVADWMHLLESIPASKTDLTPKIATYLTPADTAQARAAEFVERWKAAPDPDDIIAADPFQRVLKTTFAPDGSLAWALCAFNLECRDGLTTRAFEISDWKLDGDEWKRTLDYQPTAPVKGQPIPFGQSVLTGQLLWAPQILHELKHLAAKGGPTAGGMFVTVEFYIQNKGPGALAPASFQVFAIDKSGKQYSLSSAADKWWDGDAADRKNKIAAGDSTYLWYTWDLPEGTDLQNLKFEVLLPGI